MIRAAGILRQRIAFLEESAAQDAAGQSVPTWTGVTGSTNVPAEVLGVAGGETFRGQQVEAHIDSVITIRFRAGLKPTMKIKHEGRYLHIDKLLDPSGHKRELVIHCREIPIPTIKIPFSALQHEDGDVILTEDGKILMDES